MLGNLLSFYMYSLWLEILALNKMTKPDRDEIYPGLIPRLNH